MNDYVKDALRAKLLGDIAAINAAGYSVIMLDDDCQLIPRDKKNLAIEADARAASVAVLKELAPPKAAPAGAVCSEHEVPLNREGKCPKCLKRDYMRAYNAKKAKK